MLSSRQFRSEWAGGIKPSPVDPATHSGQKRLTGECNQQFAKCLGPSSPIAYLRPLLGHSQESGRPKRFAARTRTRRYRDPIDGLVSKYHTTCRSLRTRFEVAGASAGTAENIESADYCKALCGRPSIRTRTAACCSPQNSGDEFAAQFSLSKQALSLRRVFPGSGRVVDLGRRILSLPLRPGPKTQEREELTSFVKAPEYGSVDCCNT
jgi:hypothetical protein